MENSNCFDGKRIRKEELSDEALILLPGHKKIFTCEKIAEAPERLCKSAEKLTVVS